MSKGATETGSRFHATGTDSNASADTETGNRERFPFDRYESESIGDRERRDFLVALYLMDHNGEPCIA